MKKTELLTLIILFIMAFQLKATFRDVTGDHESAQAIQKLADAGIVIGFPDGTFKGGKKLSVYEMTVIIQRMMEELFSNEQAVAEYSDEELLLLLELMEKNEKDLIKYRDRAVAVAGELTKVKGELKAVHKDMPVLKELFRKNERLVISGDMRVRYNDYDYSVDTANSYLNENHFTNRYGLNFDILLSDNLQGTLRLERTAFWNSSGGDWTTGRATANNNDSDLQTYLAYIEGVALSGPFSYWRAGRQELRIGKGLLAQGRADGLMAEKKFNGEMIRRFRMGGYKFDSSTNDGSTNDNDGFDFLYYDWAVSIGQIQASMYSANMKNIWSKPAGSSRLSDRSVNAFMDGWAGRYGYYGLSLSTNPLAKFVIWGEYAKLAWEEEIKINGNIETGDDGFQIGVDWLMASRLSVKARFTMFEDYFFRPDIWDTDSFLHEDDDILYHSMGYRYGFKDLYAEASVRLSERIKFAYRMEKIRDLRALGNNEIPDDRDAVTSVIDFAYGPNTAIQLLYRKVSCNQDAGAASVLPAAAQARSGYAFIDTNGDGISDTGVSVSDLELLRMQLSVNF